MAFVRAGGGQAASQVSVGGWEDEYKWESMQASRHLVGLVAGALGSLHLLLELLGRLVDLRPLLLVHLLKLRKVAPAVGKQGFEHRQCANIELRIYIGNTTHRSVKRMRYT